MMNNQPSKRKTPIKSTYQYLIRAKMYGVITLNSLEGMMSELDELIPVDMEKDNIDAFSEELRRYQSGNLMPTSHGDYLDRAMRSLAKEMNLQVSVELGNSSVVKNFVSNIIMCSHGDERQQFLDWLEQPNELITKSVRFDQLVNHACMCFYKKPLASVSEDTINFIRRSIHELLRTKGTKDSLHAQLMNSNAMIAQQPQHALDSMISSYEYVDGNIYMPSRLDDGDRMIHVDIGNIRQPTEKDFEMMNHGVNHGKNGENISL